MLRDGRIFALLLMVLAGCTTVPRGQSPEVAQVPEEKSIPAPASKTNAVPSPAPHPAAPAYHFDLSETWISLERWSEASGYGVPRRINADTAVVYSFAPTNGGMAVKISSQSAWWEGVEFRLGYAPQLIDGHPFLHSLDVRKNFLPLLEKPNGSITNRILVIDPGHGGTDTGTRSVVSSHTEKDFTLDWARRLQSLLATNGWTVLLTRTNDVNVSLPGRVAFAEQHKAALFLSLHFNSSFPENEQAGLETYCLTPTGMPSNLTRNFKDDPALIYPNNHFDTENMQLAIQLQRALLKVNGHADRGVRRARFLGVLQGQNRPAVLVEGGYLSNPAEAREIADASYRQKLAEAVAGALLENYGGATDLYSKASIAPAANANGITN